MLVSQITFFHWFYTEKKSPKHYFHILTNVNKFSYKTFFAGFPQNFFFHYSHKCKKNYNNISFLTGFTNQKKKCWFHTEKSSFISFTCSHKYGAPKRTWGKKKNKTNFSRSHKKSFSWSGEKSREHKKLFSWDREKLFVFFFSPHAPYNLNRKTRGMKFRLKCEWR